MPTFGVSASGVSIQTAAGPDSLLNLKYPMTKLDTTNQNSFDTLNILFNHEPPQPTAATGYVTDTQIAQFAHGYTYIPSIWFEWRNFSATYPADPSAGGTSLTLYDFGDDSAYGNITALAGATNISPYATQRYNNGGFLWNSNTAFFYAIVDSTNVTLYLRKTAQLITPQNITVPIYLIGTSVNMRFYVFTEPATTSTY